MGYILLSVTKKLYHMLPATASTQQNRKQEFISFPPEVQRSKKSLRLKKEKESPSDTTSKHMNRFISILCLDQKTSPNSLQPKSFLSR